MDTPPKKRVQLSLAKLKGLLAKYSYTLVATYCVGDDVYFIEARTPKFQKTFIISVPLKYKMVCDDTHRRLQISPLSDSLVTSNQYMYISELKGPLIDCDLIAISSSTVCVYKNNGNAEYYKMGEQEDEGEEDGECEDIGGVEQLIKNANEIMEKANDADEDFEIGDDDEDKKETDNREEKDTDEETELTPEDLEQMKLVSPKNAIDAIELDFQDDEGGSVEDSVPLMESIVNKNQDEEEEPPKKVVKTKSDRKKSKDKEKTSILEKLIPTDIIPLKKTRKDNSLPPNLEDADIVLGIVYYCKEVGLFYKKAETLEEEIVSAYNVLDDNESDMREGKISEIAELCTNVIQKVKDATSEVKKGEEDLKAQLLTLTTILDQTDALKMRMEKNPKKFIEVKPDIERINTQTKSTIYEINMDLLKSRDAMEDILNSVKTSLEEIINI